MSFYKELITSFNKHDVQFLVFGGFAVNFYGFNRYTADLDLWINPHPDNLRDLQVALLKKIYPKDLKILDVGQLNIIRK